jgi:uncharacterized protein HemX
VSLTFSSPEYGTGKIVSLISLLLALGLAAAGFMLDKRRTAAASA